MNSIDLIIIIVVLFFFVKGIFRGFMVELSALAGFVLGYITAFLYMEQANQIIFKYFPNLSVNIANIISFALIFVFVNIIMKIIGNMLTKTLKFAMLGWLNRLLGGTFGALKGITILTIIVFFLSMIPFTDSLLDKTGKKESVLYPYLESLLPVLHEQYENIKENNKLPV